MHGTVSWFDPRRGVGTITPDDGGTDVAVHYTRIDGGGRQSLRVDTRVSFLVVDTVAGRIAVHVFRP